MTSLPLEVLEPVFTVCRLTPAASVPMWAFQGALWSITKTASELSIVCEAAHVPAEVQAYGRWRALMVAGPLDFSLTGILHALAAPLASARISIFAFSTYDTDYLLIGESELVTAVQVLQAAGHTITGDLNGASP